MSREEIGLLLKKYLDGQLTQAEMIRMKGLIQEIDDDTFDKGLEQVWESYEVTGKRNKEAFDTISRNLKEIIQPQKSFHLPYFAGRIAAAVLLLCLFATTAYLAIDRNQIQTAIAQEYKVVSEKGERASVLLPDGTKVYLNAESSLSYPASFSLRNRTVCLTGEAYFEVKHDATAPFIVKTTEVEIKVLGTTFNLCANPHDKWFEASLVEGKIEVTPYKYPQKQVYLSPLQKAHYNFRTGNLQIIKTDLQVETAWKRGDLIFRNQPFQQIIEQLESFYGMNIRVKGSYPEELFTGSYHETDVIQVLNNLQQHYTFDYQKSGNDISLIFIQ